MISVFVASQKRVAQFERVIRIEIRNASINRSGCAASGGEALLRWHDAGLGVFFTGFYNSMVEPLDL